MLGLGFRVCGRGEAVERGAAKVRPAERWYQGGALGPTPSWGCRGGCRGHGCPQKQTGQRPGFVAKRGREQLLEAPRSRHRGGTPTCKSCWSTAKILMDHNSHFQSKDLDHAAAFCQKIANRRQGSPVHRSKTVISECSGGLGDHSHRVSKSSWNIDLKETLEANDLLG